MSGECESCGEHTLECICKRAARYVLIRTCGPGCPCQFKEHHTHLNLVRNPVEEKKRFSHLNAAENLLLEGIDPQAELPPVKWINIRGRTEHEAILKDAEWCKELGLDQTYEVMVYLKRWGNWLGD